MRSTGVRKTGRSVQYGVHTDHKQTCSGAHFDVDFFGLFLFFVAAPRETSKKHMPERV